ncbi:MAG: class I SAM-dependent methyltransferase [Patescibacteria group bacterium]|nr:class I SAM-dependent methyltransferase [Patescibacteria group bacterium]
MEIRTQKACRGVCGSDLYKVWAHGKDFEYHTSDQEYCYVKCLKCGVIYLNPNPTVGEIEKIYPANYFPYKFEEGLNFITKIARNFVQRLKVRPLLANLSDDARILDGGCGNGELLRIIKKHRGSGWKLYGNDINSATGDILNRHGIEFIAGRFEEMGGYYDYFDAIILNQTIEHLHNPREIILKARRMLKRNGLLIIETPNYDSLDARIFRKRYWGGYHIPRHWHIFNKNILVGLLNECNFAVIGIQFLLSPTFWIQSLHHYFDDKHKKIAGWFNINNLFLTLFFSLIDFVLGALYATSNIRIIAINK